MKKLFVLSLLAIFTLTSFTSIAQIEDEDVETVIQDETKIEVTNLPDAVTKTLKANFANFTVEKASKVLKQNAGSLKNEAFYNVTLTNKEKSVTVLFDANGNEVKDEKEEGEKEE
jgi:hypothetical protein